MIEELPSVDVVEVAKTAGFAMPDGKVVLLPRNLGKEPDNAELLYEDDTSTVQKLLKQSGLQCVRLDWESQSIPVVHERADLTLLPAIFFSISSVIQNPNTISVALNVLSSYIFEALKGKRTGAEVQVELYFEDEEGTRGLKYRGSGKDLKESVLPIVEAMKKK